MEPLSPQLGDTLSPFAQCGSGLSNVWFNLLELNSFGLFVRLKQVQYGCVIESGSV